MRSKLWECDWWLGRVRYGMLLVSVLAVFFISPILLLPYSVLTRHRNYEVAAYQLPMLNGTVPHTHFLSRIHCSP